MATLTLVKSNNNIFIPHINGEVTPFSVVKDGDYAILECTSNHLVMSPKRFTNSQTLENYIIQANDYINSRKRFTK